MPRRPSPLSSNLAFNTTFTTVFALWAAQQALQLTFPDAYAPVVPLVTPFVAFIGNFLPGILQERHNQTVAQKEAQEKARADAEALLTSDYLSRAIGKTIGALAKQFAQTEQIDMGMDNIAALRAFAATLPAAWKTLLADPETSPSLSLLGGADVASLITADGGLVGAEQWAETLRALQAQKPSDPPLSDTLLTRLAVHIEAGFVDALRRVVTQATTDDENSSATFNRLVVDLFTSLSASIGEMTTLLQDVQATTGATLADTGNLLIRADKAEARDAALQATTEAIQGDTAQISIIREMLETGRPVSRTLKAKCIINLSHYFTGRIKELEQLREALKPAGEIGVMQAISGLGGIGKSSLARAYANAYRNEYVDGILYINASNVATVIASYEEIDRSQFDPPTPDDAPPGEAIRQVMVYFNSHDRYLLLVDNADFGPDYTADDLRAFLPGNARGHILFTTRANGSLDALEIRRNHILVLSDMEPDDAAVFLWERVNGEAVPIPSSEMEALLAIAASFYCFPLALEQASAFIVKKEITFSAYLNRQKARAATGAGAIGLLAKQKANAGLWKKEDDYRRAVETTWAENVAALIEAGWQPAVNLLVSCAFLAPDAIPLNEVAKAVFISMLGYSVEEGDDAEVFALQKGEPLLDGLIGTEGCEDFCENIIEALRDYSLVGKNIEQGTYSIHRLLQEVIRENMSSEELLVTIEATVRHIHLIFPKPEYKNWPQCDVFTPHAMAVMSHARQLNCQTDEGAKLLLEVSTYLEQRGRYQEAFDACAEALSIRRAVLPENLSELATNLNNLGLLSEAVDGASAALPLYEESLVIMQEILPANHRHITATMGNIGRLYEEQGDFDKARPLLEAAFAASREITTHDDEDRIHALNNLGKLFKSQGKYDKSLAFYEEAQIIFQASGSEDMPTLGVLLNNIAKIHEGYGLFDKAFQSYAESVAILESCWDAEDPRAIAIQKGIDMFLAKMVCDKRRVSAEDYMLLPEEEQIGLFRNLVQSFHTSVRQFAEDYK